MGEALYAAAAAPRERLWLSQSGHNDALFREPAAQLGSMQRFLAQYGLLAEGD